MPRPLELEETMRSRNPRSAFALVLMLASFAAALVAPSFAQGPPPPPPPLPPPPVPPQNPITPPKAVLGKILFWEEQMSSDNTVACGTCHVFNSAGGSDPRSSGPGSVHPGFDGVFNTPDDVQGSRGVVRCLPGGAMVDDGTFFPDVQRTARKAPSPLGSLWSPSQFWDGRAAGSFVNPDNGFVVIPAGGSLESQALAPLLEDSEMACQSRTFADVAARVQAAVPMKLATNLPPDVSAALASNPTYPALFQSAFGTPAITAQRIAFAIATYERTLVANQTPWDAFNAGNFNALTANQVAGLNAFSAPPQAAGGGCVLCHGPPTFTNNTFRNIGVRPPIEDLGRQIVTGNPGDRGRFKVPSLRNVGLRAPFFHNGRKATLTDVLNFYAIGGEFFDNQDPAINPLALSPLQISQIVDFLQNGLTDPRVAQGLPPFDRPTLHGEIVPPNPVVYGASSNGSFPSEPFIIPFQPAFTGNAQYTLGLGHAIGQTQALLAIAASPAAPGTTINGIPINVGLVPFPATIVVQVAGPPVPGGGFASITTGIANVPGMIGTQYWVQWFVDDPLAPGGVAASRGLHATIF
jgi:cytochrome c peroxidase